MDKEDTLNLLKREFTFRQRWTVRISDANSGSHPRLSSTARHQDVGSRRCAHTIE